jgi:hypothetical protein
LTNRRPDGSADLLRTPRPEPVSELAGSRRLVDTARSLVGASRWDESGTSRLRGTPVLDPELVRQLDVGQAAYVHRGGVTFVQVKRLVATQAVLTRGGDPPEAGGSGGTPSPQTPLAGAPPGPPPDAGAVLDEAFGPHPS